MRPGSSTSTIASAGTRASTSSRATSASAAQAYVALSVRKWGGSSWGTETPISSTCSEGLVNSQPVSDTLGGLMLSSCPAGQFGEAAINLVCAGVVQANSCAPFSSAYVKSLSSIFNSEIKDFMAPVDISFSACGSITIKKHTAPRDLDQSFSYTTLRGRDWSGFSLNHVGAGDTASNTKVFSGLHPGTRTVTEGSPDPAGFACQHCDLHGRLVARHVNGWSGRNRSAWTPVKTLFAPTSTTSSLALSSSQSGRSSRSDGVGVPLAGAVFTIGGGVGDVTTGTDGPVCVDNLAFATVLGDGEDSPNGFVSDDTTTTNIAVDNNAKCSDSPFVGETKTVHGHASDGHPRQGNVAGSDRRYTASRITCIGAGLTRLLVHIGNSPQPGAATFARSRPGGCRRNQWRQAWYVRLHDHCRSVDGKPALAARYLRGAAARPSPTYVLRSRRRFTDIFRPLHDGRHQTRAHDHPNCALSARRRKG